MSSEILLTYFSVTFFITFYFVVSSGMVMCGGEAANEVLGTLNWEKINIELIANRQSLKDVYDVRAWSIYLILAFLNSSEEPNLTKQFLHKKGKYLQLE